MRHLKKGEQADKLYDRRWTWPPWCVIIRHHFVIRNEALALPAPSSSWSFPSFFLCVALDYLAHSVKLYNVRLRFSNLGTTVGRVWSRKLCT